MPAPQDIHSCSWFCELPNCVLAQRDELRERMAELQDNGNRLLAVADSAVAHQRDMIEAACAPLHERIAELESFSMPVGWQWLNTAHFRRHLPTNANRGEWRRVYAQKD